jgi:predicted metal-binding protein
MAACVELLICTTCRGPATPQGADDVTLAPEEAPRAGLRLFRALLADPPAEVRLRPVECLSNCSRGCTVVLRGPGRWSFVYGGLAPADGPALVRRGAALYRAVPDGLVPWRDRPEHFRRHVIARIPPQEFPDV